jgi:hypothetical protein
MMSDYTEFLDDTYGLAPARKQASFNNVLYSLELCAGKHLAGTLEDIDLDYMKRHLYLNKDIYGLYTPKNSHDNMTAKLLFAEYFKLYSFKKEMNLLQMILYSNLHPRDVIIYLFMKGNPLIRLLSRFFLWIPALMMIQSCMKKWKVRPILSPLEKLKIFFDRTKIIKKSYFTDTDGYYKEFSTKDGMRYSIRYIQNDGKILAPMRLLVLKDQSWTMKICGKICQRILKKRYGKNYMGQLFNNYFIRDEDHPVRLAWKEIGDIL